MREYPRINKLMVLFESMSNPLWNDIFVGEEREDHFYAAAGIQHGTFYKWASGEPVKRKSVDTVFANILKHIDQLPGPQRRRERARKKVEAFQKVVHDESAKIYAGARILGYALDDAQMLIDQKVLKRYPLLPHAYLPENRGKIVLERFGGVHHLYMRREAHVLRCTLRVRYLLRLHGADEPTVRCKLNIPNLERFKQKKPKIEHWEYDGFVADRDWAMFWTFNKRGDDRADFFFAVSDHGNVRKGAPGHIMNYLTTGQDSNQTALPGVAVMERADQGFQKDATAVQKFMHEECVVLTAARGEEVLKRIKAQYDVDL